MSARRTAVFAIAAALPLVAAAAAPVDQGAVRRGEQLYTRCIACHSMATDRVGPRHCGVFGRKAGTVPGFDYSPAMRSSRLVWDEKTLDRFLKSPMHTVPGTRMTYDGVPDAKERHDLIAYLRSAPALAECRK